MLHLSRKESESIFVPGRSLAQVRDWDGDGIEIVVLEISGDKVKIGIDCPDSLDVYRHEVWRQIRREERKERGHGISST